MDEVGATTANGNSTIEDERQSLRGFLHLVEKDFPDQLIRIKEPVSTRLDITSTIFELERAGKSPVVIFENVTGHDIPVVTNIAANRDLLAATLGVDSSALPSTYRERCQNYTPVELVDTAPWQDVVMEGDDVDLAKLPIPFHFTVDQAPYITAGQITARDPESGVDTTGFHRLMFKDKNRLGVSVHSRRRMYEFHRRAEAKGENLPVAISLGIHPLHYMGSMAFQYPPEIRKYEIIGGLFGEPYRVVNCDDTGLQVPAGAEIVIEGEILADVREPEGPFGEFTGYASYRSTENVFVAKRLSMRADAMFHSIVSGMSKDHILISCVTREAEIANALKRNLPNVKAVHVPHITCGGFLAVVSIKKTAPGEAQQAIIGALATDFYTKCVVVVDEYIDVFNLADVIWAVVTRVQAEKDLVFIPGAKGAILDPTSDPTSYTTTKVGVDATKPDGLDYAERLYITDEQRARGAEILSAAGIYL